jgi:uncharacterized protein (DUF305 family)
MYRRICRAAALAAVALLTALPGAAQAKGVTATDRAFVREMVPHHEMAIEMAEMARRQATHQRIKTLAKSIIEDQNAEIRRLTAIRKRLEVKPLPSGSAEHDAMMRDAETLGLSMDEMGMDMDRDMDELDAAKPFDRAFIDMMITHHQGAIRMAPAELAKGRSSQLRAIAGAIVAAQKAEIIELNRWRKVWDGATSPSGGVPPS